MKKQLAITPITYDLSDPEDKQSIVMLTGLLRQQEQWTANAIAEVMRLRKIIKGCDRCRSAANSEIAT